MNAGGRVWRRYGASMALVIVALGIWEVWVRAAGTPTWLLPAPSRVAVALFDDRSILAPATIITLREVLLGYVVAVIVGLGLAIVMHLFGPIRRAVYPLLIGSQTIPIVVLAPILVIVLGYGLLPKLVIVALICFFPIVVNALDGLRSVDDELIHMMRTLDADRWALLRRVEFPTALPAIFSGLRIAATFAAIGAVFGEWAGSSGGLGFVMLQSTANLQTARILAAVLILTLIAVALFAAVSALERALVPWAPRGSVT